MAEPSRVKVARHRAHKRGDHTACLATCPLAGTIERRDLVELRQAVEAEFRDDPTRLAVALPLVEAATAKGPGGVQALRELSQTIEAKRRGELAPAVTPTVDDEIREMVRQLDEAAFRRGYEAGQAEGRRS